MIGRKVLQALAAALAAGFLCSSSCYVSTCSGDCYDDDDDHNHNHVTKDTRDHIVGHRQRILGLPPGDVTRLLTSIHGPWLLPEERAEARLLADFAGRVLAANRDLLGLSVMAELAFDARVEGEVLLLESHVRDVLGPCRITLRIEPTGRLSAARVDRPGL